MSEEQQHTAGEAASVSRAQTPGELLRRERERLGRTVQQFAEEMHLGVHMIEALEANRFSVLGAPVFARGHLRKYAMLLGVSVEQVQQLYEAMADQPSAPDPVPVIHRSTEPSIAMTPDSRARRAVLQPTQWVLIVAGGALALVILIAWLLVGGQPTAPQESVVDAASAPIESAPPAEATVTPPAATTASTPAPPAAAVPAQSQASQPKTVVTPRRKVTLRFTFAQESWVEVYDSRGTRLLYDVGQPGQSRSVEVEPPAQVVLGQAAGVTTEVNGKAVELPAQRGSSQVAKFTVSPDGTAQ
jgi:cytoskeleton protein RodZ